MNTIVITFVSIPAVAVLLSNATFALFAFIAILPLDSIAIGTNVGIPKLVGIVAFGAWLFSLAIKKKPIQWDRSLSIYLLFVFFGELSFLWSSNPDLTIQAFSTYLLAFMIPFLLLNICDNKQALDWMMMALALAGIITVCSGLIDLFQVIGTRGRVAGIVENANEYATWCVISLPGLYWLWMKWRNWLGRVALIVIFIGLLVTILYSLSRGGYISLLVFALSVILLSRVRLSVLIIFILIGLLLFWFMPEEQTARFAVLLSGKEVRIEILWPMGIDAFLNSPLVGYGLGTNGWILERVYRAPNSVHSAPLAVAIELGIIGLLFYLGFIIIILSESLKRLRYLRQIHSPLYTLQISIIAAFVAFLFSWIKGGGMEYSKILFLLSGYLLAINRIDAAEVVHDIPQIVTVSQPRLIKEL